MARLKRTHKKIRLNLDLSTESIKRLHRLLKKGDADSMSEVIRRATKVYEDVLVALRDHPEAVIILYSNKTGKEGRLSLS